LFFVFSILSPCFGKDIWQNKRFLWGLHLHIFWWLMTDLEKLMWSYYQPFYMYTLARHFSPDGAMHFQCHSLSIRKYLDHDLCIGFKIGGYFVHCQKNKGIRNSSKILFFKLPCTECLLIFVVIKSLKGIFQSFQSVN